MGLFDTIQIDYPIEGIVPFEDQTKALICYSEQYRIDASGQLLLLAHDHAEYTDDEKAENLRKSPTFGELRNLSGKRINPRWEPQSDVALLALSPDENTIVYIYLMDGKVKDVTVKRLVGAPQTPP